MLPSLAAACMALVLTTTTTAALANPELATQPENQAETPATCEREACQIYIVIDASSQSLTVFRRGHAPIQMPVTTPRNSLPMNGHPIGLQEDFIIKRVPAQTEAVAAIFTHRAIPIVGAQSDQEESVGILNNRSYAVFRLRKDDAARLVGWVKDVGIQKSWISFRDVR